MEPKQSYKGTALYMPFISFFTIVLQVISSEEAELRGQTYDSVGRTYLFDLDFNGDDCPFTVDAALYGNVSHFVNHCVSSHIRPNKKKFVVFPVPRPTGSFRDQLRTFFFNISKKKIPQCGLDVFF